MKRVFVSDCEGPISKNDNAFELTAHFVPDGDNLFSIVSKYDDVLADVVKKPGYNAGDTLKLILPFLKAYEVTDKKMQEFSAQNLLLIAGSKDTLKHIRSLSDAFIVSTSYEHYIRVLCKTLEFPFENTYCTRFSLNKYAITQQETIQLKEKAQEISSMPMITIPPKAKSLKDFSNRDQETVKRLDKIFWMEIAGMDCGRIFSEVKTVGGVQKAQAIREVVSKFLLPLSSVMYVGDSITDVEAFRLVRENGGLTVSFNGNDYAVRNAEIAILAENNTVTAILADVFLKHGKAQTLKLAESKSTQALKNRIVSPDLAERFSTNHAFPKVQIVTAQNMELLSKESSEYRKKVRGEAVGKLG